MQAHSFSMRCPTPQPCLVQLRELEKDAKNFHGNKIDLTKPEFCIASVKTLRKIDVGENTPQWGGR